MTGKQYALISVKDKSTLPAIGRRLVDHAWGLISTTNSLLALREAELPVVDGAEISGLPTGVDFGHKVCTLTPQLHGGIAAQGSGELGDLKRIGGLPIDLVIVDPYPLHVGILEGRPFDELNARYLDIGGPALLRNAAKNGKAVVCDLRDVDRVLDELEQNGSFSPELLFELATKVFLFAAGFDAMWVWWRTFHTAGVGGSHMQNTTIGRYLLSFRLIPEGEPHPSTGAFFAGLGKMLVERL